MKRQLTDTEKSLTKKGVAKRETEITETKQSLEIYRKQQTYINTKREYEDYVRPFNRKAEDNAIDKAILKCEADLKIATTDLENLNTQLTEGIEKNTPSGVN